MFRQMRRIKQQISEEECVRVLREAPRGVLAVHGEDGYPYALPLDHLYKDGKLYFHCATEGHKLDAIAADSRVSFCVMDEGFRKPGDWALNIRSVVVFGHIRVLEDREEAQSILRELALKYFPTAEEAEKTLAKHFPKALLLELSIDHMTGKLVRES